MTTKQTLAHILIISSLLFFNAGCQKTSDNTPNLENKFVYKDIIAEYERVEKWHLTTAFDITESMNNFLLSGWLPGLRANEVHRWAEGLESQFFFIGSKNRKTILKFQCLPYPKENLQQVIDIFLNEHFVEKILLSPQESIYEIALPEEYLQDEVNYITFKYAYTNKNWNKLSVAFKSIAIDIDNATDEGIELIDAILRQPIDTYFNYYVRLPANSYMRLNLKNNKKVNGVVKISADGLPSEIYHLDQSGEQYLDISQFSNKYVKISFRTNYTADIQSSEEGYIEWSDIKIITENEKSSDSTPEPTSGEIVKMKEALSTYDIIYLVLDAFNLRHSSLYGYDRKTTPFIDTISQESIVFENMFANAPYTLASTGTLFTSHYSYEHGLINETDRLSPIIPTISELLSTSGIDTYLISDHGFVDKAWGLIRGFSHITRFKNFRELREDPNKLIEALNAVYATDLSNRKFVYLHLVPPHGPYLPPSEFRIFTPSLEESKMIEPNQENLQKIYRAQVKISEEQLAYIESLYDANVLFADHLTEMVCTFLESQGRLNKSIIFITTDHGEAFMEHAENVDGYYQDFGKTLHGTTVFDEMIHIPFLIRFPEELQILPRRIDHIASIIDIAPTLKDIYGIEFENNFSGRSLLPAILYDVSFTPFIYAEALLPKTRTIRDLHYKYIVSGGRKMLFDVSQDALEQHDLLSDLPVTAGYYHQLMRPFLDQRPSAFAKDEINLNHLNDKTIEELRDLGYLR